MADRSVLPSMPKLECPDCAREVGVHELDTQTVAAGGTFTTRIRCPFCRSTFEDVSALL